MSEPRPPSLPRPRIPQAQPPLPVHWAPGQALRKQTSDSTHQSLSKPYSPRLTPYFSVCGCERVWFRERCSESKTEGDDFDRLFRPNNRRSLNENRPRQHENRIRQNRTTSRGRRSDNQNTYQPWSLLSSGCQVIIHVPSSWDDLAQEFSRFGWD